MSSEINRIRNLPSKVRFRHGESAEGATDLPLDHRLTFSPSSDEKWTFEDEHVYFNEFDVNELINDSGHDIHFLCGLSAALDQYRQHVWDKGGKSEEKFNGMVNALLEKILCRLGNIYDGIFSGLRFEYTGGDFWINDVNVRLVVNLYRLRPTTKARCYLVGLRHKLSLIISAQNGSARYNGVTSIAAELFNDISCALDSITPDDVGRCLPPHGSD